MARHAQDDVLLLMDQDLEAVSILLGDKPFLFGDRPYEVDASVFGILDIMLYHKGSAPELEGLVSDHARPTAYQLHHCFRAVHPWEIHLSGIEGGSPWRSQ